MTVVLDLTSAASAVTGNSTTPVRIVKKSKVQLFQSIAEELRVQMESFRNGHILRLTNGSVQKLIVGYSFPLNDAAAARSCADKTAGSAIFEIDQVPHVEHVLATECDLDEFGEQHNYNLVAKPKDGQMGDGVVRINNRTDLQAIAKVARLCLSPYYEIEHEFRVVMLNHIPQVVFEKMKPHIIGDGHSTVAELIGEFYRTTPPSFLKKMKEFNPAWLPLSKVLKNGESMHLQWKHSAYNARVLDPTEEDTLLGNIHNLAVLATKSLGILFSCVDIVSIKGDSLRVLEVNSSVWLEDDEIGAESVYKIYKSAVSSMLGLSSSSVAEESKIEKFV